MNTPVTPTRPGSSATGVAVSVIIVNWNGQAHLTDCLDSLAAQTFQDFEVVLVDNGSTDGSCQLVGERYKWVRLISLERNTGFATGNNVGLANANGKYIVALNNDTQVASAWLGELVRVADADSKVGMVASRICAYADRDCIDSLGVAICSDGMSRGNFRQRRFSALNVDSAPDILFPSACAALYRRDMIECIGFFDDDFFAYCEDTDLGLRARIAGWDAVLARDAVVYHKYSQTGGEFSPLKLYLVERNHYWVAIKNFPVRMLLLLPFTTFLRYLAQLRAVIFAKGSGKAFISGNSRVSCIAALVKGMFHAFLGIPGMLAKRRLVMAQRRLSERDQVILMKKYQLSFEELLDAS